MIEQQREPDYAHPSQDHSGRFRTDAYLRRHGFRIYSRPREGQALWEKDGNLHTQSEAVEIASCL